MRESALTESDLLELIFGGRSVLEREGSMSKREIRMRENTSCYEGAFYWETHKLKHTEQDGGF